MHGHHGLNTYARASILICALALTGCGGSSSSPSGETATPITDQPTNGEIDKGDPKTEIAISLHPVSQSAYVQDSVTFNVSASSEATLSYQWRKDGNIIADAVRPSYALGRVTLDDAGRYDVVVSAGNFSVTSLAANLAVTINRTARFEWTTPTQRSDGAALLAADIAGYRIYHTHPATSLSTQYDLLPSQTSFELSDLVSGDHYFEISTLDTGERESARSAKVLTTVF